jgi:hypothetical protein
VFIPATCSRYSRDRRRDLLDEVALAALRGSERASLCASLTQVAYTGGGSEHDDEQSTKQEQEEAEHLARTVVLPRVAVPGCREYYDVGDSDNQEDPGPEPQ